jgi:hypothetical protein
MAKRKKAAPKKTAAPKKKTVPKKKSQVKSAPAIAGPSQPTSLEFASEKYRGGTVPERVLALAGDDASLARGRILNCRPSRVTLDRVAPLVRLGMAAVGPTPTPIDYRAPGWPVGDQLQTGACVGWAVGDGVLRWHFVRKGLISPAERLSARYLWMAAKELDEFERERPESFIESAGTSIAAALRVARELGCATEQVLPFAEGHFFKESTERFYRETARLRIRDYVVLSLAPIDWKQWLSARKGPLAIRVQVDDKFQKAELRGNFDPPPQDSGHAATLVGFLREGNQDRFIVRNSWGVAWGENGFALADEGYLSRAVTECFGVLID